MKPTIAIALSGGIDSLMTAAILKNKGCKLLGLHFFTGFEPYLQNNAFQLSPSIDEFKEQAYRSLAQTVKKIDIPIFIIDLRTEFKAQVIDYFVRTYQKGRTPNPCLKCNPAIKFGVLLEKANQHGASHIATGHYAKLITDSYGRVRLYKGTDRKKDQSYFLSRLNQKQLQSTLLPLGEYTKHQIRKMAAAMGLQAADSQESQDICFIKSGNYGQFLRQQPGFEAKPGPIVDLNGKTLGQHNGLHLFTIGQRRGINCPAAEPYYVIRINKDQNSLIVGYKKDLDVGHFKVYGINWIAPAPEKQIQIKVRVRYRHKAVPATITPIGSTKAKIVFDTPQPGVAPGQGAVFYLDDEVLGGGWIR